MMRPPPMKPMPVTTPAAIGTAWRLLPRPSSESSANVAAPIATRVWVLTPAFLWCHCRSIPTTVPTRMAAARRRRISLSLMAATTVPEAERVAAALLADVAGVGGLRGGRRGDVDRREHDRRFRCRLRHDLSAGID